MSNRTTRFLAADIILKAALTSSDHADGINVDMTAPVGLHLSHQGGEFTLSSFNAGPAPQTVAQYQHRVNVSWWWVIGLGPPPHLGGGPGNEFKDR